MTLTVSVAERTSRRAFVGIFASLFFASAALTIIWCGSMSAMQEMPMPGGWMMSMTWMRMPGQAWPEAAASFIGLWFVMMVAMMLPSLAPMLWRCREAIRSTGEIRKAGLTALVGAGYFCVWTLFGIAVYPLGVALAAAEMKQPLLARTAPIATGIVVLIAGTMQFTSFKEHHLACCREAPGRVCGFPPHAGAAWRHGLDLGLHCIYCCGSFSAVLLAVGVMDLRAMALATVAITVERLAPGGKHVARALGAVLVAVGLLVIARAAGFA